VWQAIETGISSQTIRAYRLEVETVRLDATTVSGYHLVNEAGLFQFGHSKDDHSPVYGAQQERGLLKRIETATEKLMKLGFEL
jgi:hypothetical protein